MQAGTLREGLVGEALLPAKSQEDMSEGLGGIQGCILKNRPPI